MENKPFPILGTAMWGWTVPKSVCFELLDTFYEKGFRQIDTATNYPINKNPEDFRRAENILKEWTTVNGIHDLEVLVKAGSLNNLGGPENNLTKSFLLIILDEYEFLLHKNLHTFSIHWDNRSDENAIRDTFEAFEIAADNGLKVGLSGIKHPEIYGKINEDFDLNFRIQIKHNLFYSDYQRYSPLHDNGRFLTYGINAGGQKLDLNAYHSNSSLKVRGGNTAELHPITQPLEKLIKQQNTGDHPTIKGFNDCALCFAYHQEGVEAVLIGTSKKEQLIQSLDFLQSLKEYDYLPFYHELKKLSLQFQ